MVPVLLLVAVAVGGCLDKPSPVYVLASKVPAEWMHETHNQTESVGAGNLEIVINHYTFDDNLVGEVFLVGVTDVPFVNEVEQLQDHVDGQVEQQQVKITKTDERKMTLDNGQSVDLVTYDIRKQSTAGEVRGKAWRMSWDDGDFIGGGFGYATTEYRGLLGQISDDTQWQNVQAMMRAADW